MVKRQHTKQPSLLRSLHPPGQPAEIGKLTACHSQLADSVGLLAADILFQVERIISSMRSKMRLCILKVTRSSASYRVFTLWGISSR
jgi:hypothetical protein